MDVLRQAARTLEIEANAATDNPLVLTGALFAALPIVMGAGAAGIVIFVRSRSLNTATVAAVDSNLTGNQRMF